MSGLLLSNAEIETAISNLPPEGPELQTLPFFQGVSAAIEETRITGPSAKNILLTKGLRESLNQLQRATGDEKFFANTNLPASSQALPGLGIPDIQERLDFLGTQDAVIADLNGRLGLKIQTRDELEAEARLRIEASQRRAESAGLGGRLVGDIIGFGTEPINFAVLSLSGGIAAASGASLKYIAASEAAINAAVVGVPEAVGLFDPERERLGIQRTPGEVLKNSGEAALFGSVIAVGGVGIFRKIFSRIPEKLKTPSIRSAEDQLKGEISTAIEAPVKTPRGIDAYVEVKQQAREALARGEFPDPKPIYEKHLGVKPRPVSEVVEARVALDDAALATAEAQAAGRDKILGQTVADRGPLGVDQAAIKAGSELDKANTLASAAKRQAQIQRAKNTARHRAFVARDAFRELGHDAEVVVKKDFIELTVTTLDGRTATEAIARQGSKDDVRRSIDSLATSLDVVSNRNVPITASTSAEMTAKAVGERQLLVRAAERKVVQANALRERIKDGVLLDRSPAGKVRPFKTRKGAEAFGRGTFREGFEVVKTGRGFGITEAESPIGKAAAELIGDPLPGPIKGVADSTKHNRPRPTLSESVEASTRRDEMLEAQFTQKFTEPDDVIPVKQKAGESSIPASEVDIPDDAVLKFSDEFGNEVTKPAKEFLDEIGDELTVSRFLKGCTGA